MAALIAMTVISASCGRGSRANSDAPPQPQGLVASSAHVVFSNERKERLLDWLATELPKHIPFPVSRTEWKGFTTVVPQLRVETRPVALTLQLEEDESYVPEEIRELADHFKPVLDQQKHSRLAQARSRIEVMSTTLSKPATSGKELILGATDLDPRAVDVDQVLMALSNLTNGFTIDLVNLAIRVPGSQTWIPR